MEGPGNLELRHVCPIDLRKPGIAHPARVGSVIGPIPISSSLPQERRAKEATSKGRKKAQNAGCSFAHIPERLADWEQRTENSSPTFVGEGLLTTQKLIALSSRNMWTSANEGCENKRCRLE